MELDQGHLFVGVDVQVVNQGEYQGTFLVAEDETIDFTPVGPVFIGYGYTSKVTTMPAAAAGSEGSTYGSEKRVRRIKPYFLDTCSYRVTAEESDEGEETSTLSSGFKDTQVLSNFTMETTFSIEQRLPYPSSIVSTVIELDK